MSQFLEQLSNPFFWFSTVIIGIIVGVISNFATKGVQTAWSQFSTTQKRIAKEQAEAFEIEIQSLINNPAKVTDLKIDMVISLLRSIVLVVLYLVLANLSFILPLFGGIGQYVVVAFNFLISVGAVSTILQSLSKYREFERLLGEYNSRINTTP